jgi:hexosaminidase
MMANFGKYRFYIAFGCLLTLLAIKLNAQSQVVPTLSSWKSAKGSLVLKPDFVIAVSQKDVKIIGLELDNFVKDLKRNTKLSPKVVIATTPKAGDIHFELSDDKNTLSQEAYELNINQLVYIKAKSAHGIFYATQTLLQVLKQTGNRLEMGLAIDGPTFESRGIMIDVGRKYFSMSYLKQVIRQLGWYKMNTLHLHFTEWSAFRLKSDKYPGLAAPEAYSYDDVQALQKFAKQYHVMIVPEIDFPAHSTAINDYRPDLAFQCESMRKSKWQGDVVNNAGRAWTMDVTRPEVRTWVKGLIDEFVPWFEAPYFHMGGDEYQYDPEKIKCPELMEAMKKKGYPYPGDMFVDFINEMNEHIKSKGKITQIWNWWRFNKDQTSIQPSKDIVVNIWNKAMVNTILNDGYKAIITPEEELYVSPGLVDTTGYGLVKCKVVYETWKPEIRPTILGYKICVWADKAEHHDEAWFEGHSFEPKVVLAEKTWSGKGSATLEEFLKRVSFIGEISVLD